MLMALTGLAELVELAGFVAIAGVAGMAVLAVQAELVGLAALVELAELQVQAGSVPAPVPVLAVLVSVPVVEVLELLAVPFGSEMPTAQLVSVRSLVMAPSWASLYRSSGFHRHCCCCRLHHRLFVAASWHSAEMQASPFQELQLQPQSCRYPARS